MDRRKTVHQTCVNVMSLTTEAVSAISSQVSSLILPGFPSAAGDASDIQTLLGDLNSDLNAWYTAWRGTEPVEPVDPGFLGVFGTATAFSGNLATVSPVMRLVRNDYAYVGALAMAYEQLYSVALALKSTAPGLSTLALTGLESIVPIVKSLSETMCTVTIRDLHNQDSSIKMSVATQAIADTQTAWS